MANGISPNPTVIAHQNVVQSINTGKERQENDARSGMVATTAPTAAALFPIFLPKKLSPIAAPSAACVILSKFY